MPSLSERVAALDNTEASQNAGLANDLRVITMHVARAEASLLRYEQRYSSWTKPDLLLRMQGAQ